MLEIRIYSVWRRFQKTSRSLIFFIAGLLFIGSLEKSIAMDDSLLDCTAKLDRFVEELDAVLKKNPRSVTEVTAVTFKLHRTSGCSKENVFNSVRKSIFFTGAFDWGAGISFGFQSDSFEAGFSFHKTDGTITLPNAKVRLPRTNHIKT